MSDNIIPNSKLAEAVDSLKKLNEPTPLPTIEQISQELNAWLQEHGVVLEIVAIGKRTGMPCAMDDFMPDTHIPSVTLARLKQ